MQNAEDCSVPNARPRVAVFVVAHGSPEERWNERVDEVVKQARLSVPVRVGFLSNVQERSIENELALLESEGYESIIVVPLFVSEGSTHLRDIQMMLGLMDVPGMPEGADLQPLSIQAKLIWCSPLHDTDSIRRLWEARLLELIDSPERETLLLIGHGSEEPGYMEKWQQLLQTAANHLQERFCLRRADYATILPDTIRQKGIELSEDGRLLVLPLFISEGYFTQRAIPKRLLGLTYEYHGQTYLPHPLIAAWIQDKVNEQLAGVFG